MRARLLLSFLLLVTAAVSFPRLSEAQTACTVYFYSPETNINNYSLLKAEFDAYLAGHGKYLFQPFSKRTDFETFTADKTNGVLLVSSWHYRKLKDALPLEPVLVGTVREASTQKRVLSAKKDVEGLFSLGGQKIASAGGKEFTATVLLSMLGEERRELIDSFKILVVPKDIDALLAVSFGMAKAALTTDGSLNKLEKANPKQYSLLQQLATSGGTLLPVVAVPKGSGAEVKGLLSVIEAMGEQPEGIERLKMIGLDRFRKLDESELRTLAQ